MHTGWQHRYVVFVHLRVFAHVNFSIYIYIYLYTCKYLDKYRCKDASGYRIFNICTYRYTVYTRCTCIYVHICMQQERGESWRERARRRKNATGFGIISLFEHSTNAKAKTRRPTTTPTATSRPRESRWGNRERETQRILRGRIKTLFDKHNVVLKPEKSTDRARNVALILKKMQGDLEFVCVLGRDCVLES